MSNASARLKRSVSADARSTAVPIPYWLLSTKKTTGRRHSSAMFMTSASTPWLTAPSPNIAMATDSSSR